MHSPSDGSRVRPPAGADGNRRLAFVVNSIALDGETTWFEGVMLVAVYVLLALAFFFATAS